jgi:hypothetical protein
MPSSLFSTALSAVVVRLSRVPVDDSAWKTLMRLWSACDHGFDEHMLRDIGLSDGIYRRRGQDKLN